MNYYVDLKKKLFEMLEPSVTAMGMELVHIDYSGGKNGHLHLYIDREGGVTIEDCEKVNRAASELLDAGDPIASSYTLEVSSPGLDRPLGKPEHFLRFRGEKVKLKVIEALDGRKNFTGTIAGFNDGILALKLDDDAVVNIAFTNIHKANLVYNWKRQADQDR